MKTIAIYCVNYQSDHERDQYLSSIQRAADKAKSMVKVNVFVANNSEDHNPGYFGAVRELMQKNDPSGYDYSIISNVDLEMDEDFLTRLAQYECNADTGWIAPRIWSGYEGRDKNPARLVRPSLRRLKALSYFFRHPMLERLYTKTLYRRKKLMPHPAGRIYAGHGSTIILTKQYFARCGSIDYPVFLFCEELYLAEQCRKAGLTVEYVPDISVYDIEHVSIGKMPHSTYCRHNYEAVSYIISHFYQ